MSREFFREIKGGGGGGGGGGESRNKPQSVSHSNLSREDYINYPSKPIHTAVHGLYFSKNQGMIGRRIFCEAICSIHIGQIVSTAWFNHRTDSESEST